MKSTLLNLFVLSGMILRFLFSTLFGTLVTFILLYWFTRQCTDIGTYSFWELVLWIDSQSDETKGLLLSSALTIAGFLVAFQAATRNWKDEIKANIRLEVAGAIDSTYSPICRLISSLGIYAQMHLAIHAKLQSATPSLELFREIQFALSQNKKFCDERAQLSALHIESFNLFGRYFSVLFAIDKGTEHLASINNKVADVAQVMWLAIPDERLIEDRDFSRLYLDQLDAAKFQELATKCETARQFVSAHSGHLKGQILTPLMEVTFGTFLNFVRHGRSLFGIMDSIKKGEQVDMSRLGGADSPKSENGK